MNAESKAMQIHKPRLRVATYKKGGQTTPPSLPAPLYHSGGLSQYAYLAPCCIQMIFPAGAIHELPLRTLNTCQDLKTPNMTCIKKGSLCGQPFLFKPDKPRYVFQFRSGRASSPCPTPSTKSVNELRFGIVGRHRHFGHCTQFGAWNRTPGQPVWLCTSVCRFCDPAPSYTAVSFSLTSSTVVDISSRLTKKSLLSVPGLAVNTPCWVTPLALAPRARRPPTSTVISGTVSVQHAGT
jgi:hypothetical protein